MVVFYYHSTWFGNAWSYLISWLFTSFLSMIVHLKFDTNFSLRTLLTLTILALSTTKYYFNQCLRRGHGTHHSMGTESPCLHRLISVACIYGMHGWQLFKGSSVRNQNKIYDFLPSSFSFYSFSSLPQKKQNKTLAYLGLNHSHTATHMIANVCTYTQILLWLDM